jgi:exonuclease III
MLQAAYSANRRKDLPNLCTPEELWYSDLHKLIQEKQSLGHEIIVAGDFNDDLNNEQGP